MMKVEIVLDEDKIKAEGEYEVEEIKRCVCDPFEQNGLRKVETTDGSIVYCDKNRDNDYAWLWGANFILVDEVWFIHYVKSWLWVHDENIEDILEIAKTDKVGVFA